MDIFDSWKPQWLRGSEWHVRYSYHVPLKHISHRKSFFYEVLSPTVFNSYGWMRALLSTEMKYHIVSIPPSFLQDPCASRFADECGPISSRREANGEGDSCAAADCLDVAVEASRWNRRSLQSSFYTVSWFPERIFDLFGCFTSFAFLMSLLLLPEHWRQVKGAALSWKSHLVSCKAVTAWQSRLSAVCTVRF